ncbi:hypothetical protein K466DRAFT_320124 [Polyporus arcularius HHB13444]|uniref:Uncharacterized protein n=1 Tax=Polyporus arcularius HHB13444 TaxID=1314778 RepID=A0A5C3PPY5_9APHY|nr:hypothetical protein K466DRAFT_320124 [Polyporus arcularius HHB13444]
MPEVSQSAFIMPGRGLHHAVRRTSTSSVERTHVGQGWPRVSKTSVSSRRDHQTADEPLFKGPHNHDATPQAASLLELTNGPGRSNSEMTKAVVVLRRPNLCVRGWEWSVAFCLHSCTRTLSDMCRRQEENAVLSASPPHGFWYTKMPNLLASLAFAHLELHPRVLRDL